MKHFRLLSSLALLILAIACTDDATQSSARTRAHDPWVMRSVLDSMPRMITLALSDDLWVAYSTVDCALYKAWRGHVNFDGAVFTTAHGPQPVSTGDAYIHNVFTNPWKLSKNGQEIPSIVNYIGHRIENNRATLIYEMRTEGLQPIRITETPEVVENNGGQTGFERTFTVENLVGPYEVHFQTNIQSIASRSNIRTNGQLVVYEEKKRPFGNLEVTEIEGHLILGAGETKLTCFFVNRPTIRNPNTIEEDFTRLPLGQRLIARNDCKTCHNTQVRTIGPAYVDVAKRYPTSESAVDMLANKIIKGGAGVWGIQVMSAHPDLSLSDAREMVRYILSLDPDDRGEVLATSAIPEDAYLMPSDIGENTLVPGALTEVFTFQNTLRAIPDRPARKPVMAGVMPNFDNISGDDFTGLSDRFALYSSGYLQIPEEGVYTIRLWSDDGSRLTLNGEVVIDHDGIHGTTSKEVALGLKAGYFPFDLVYFQEGGEKFLSLNWKRPGQSDFEVIPRAYYFHEMEQQGVLAGLTLPMSAVKQTPGDQYPLEEVHPAFDLAQARPYDFLPKVGGMDFLSDGRLVVCTWDPTGSVYILDHLDAENPNDIQVRRIAKGLAEPLGLKVVDDEIYVLQKQELTRLVDLDGDDMIEQYEVVSNKWRTSANFHEFAFGLEYADGNFYATLATAILPGGASVDRQIPDRGKVIRIRQADGSVTFLAHGLRTPNGIGFGVDDQLFVADNQGDWLPSSKIVHVREGAWYGSRSVDFAGTEGLEETPPVVWLPQDQIGNSPSTPGLLIEGPYAGQMFHGEVTHGGLKRVFVEHVNGVYQGCVFRFVQGLEAGVNRVTRGPEGALYVGGIGNPGNWAQTGKLWYGLQKLKYNGQQVFEMLAVRAKTNGIEVEFTEPLRQGDGWDAEDWEIRQWRYVPTEAYGGPKVDERQLEILSANVSRDRKTVFLELAGMRAGHVLYVHLRDQYVSAAGRQLWSTEAWYTMNQIPQDQWGFKSQPDADYTENTLTPEEAEQGWTLLFDGKTLDQWKGYNHDTVVGDWTIENGTIHLDVRKDSDGQRRYPPRKADIMTRKKYENFELNLEWKISNCGNSGIIFSVRESEKWSEPYFTGPEMQILDNSCHPDARIPTHRAGDLYDMIETKYVTVKPAGAWNKVRLIKRDGKVEHWLNGIKVVEYEMYHTNWDKMIRNSKFADWEDFGRARSGHIALQDHDDEVWFRNIKILEL